MSGTDRTAHTPPDWREVLFRRRYLGVRLDLEPEVFQQTAGKFRVGGAIARGIVGW